MDLIRARGSLARRSAALLLAAALLPAPAAYASCKLARLPDMPVTMDGLVPMVHAQINGSDALFIADSGAFFSLVTPSAVTQFDMKHDTRYLRGLVTGVGGEESAAVVRAKTFSIMGFTVPDVVFIVAGRNLHGAAGLLGQNVFRLGDVEYDLANGVIRIVRPTDCKGTSLAYWAAAAGKQASAVDIDFATAREPHTVAVAHLNGYKIRVMFDTGAGRSMLTLAAAKHAGVTPQSEGVEDGGTSRGIGPKAAKSWIARFASFKLGDEEIAHARLRFADFNLFNADMLIGADFFLSHRVYVATSQRKLYFSYNGGPVFDLEAVQAPPEPADEGGATSAAAEPAAPNSDRPQADLRLDEPADAAGFARRGEASAARHDYAAALADLTRACELAPTEANYFYRRALVRWSSRQQELALADLDQALKLKPDDVAALTTRARLKMARNDSAGAAADLEAADHAATREADERLRIAAAYEAFDNPAAARLQYTTWIDSHRDDSRMAGILNSRCWDGALSGQQLEQALADCNAALKKESGNASFLDSRGLVHLRLGNYDKAIADYDAALRLQPKIAWSLYGRGLARLHKGQTAGGQADIAAATALQPKIAERAAKFGISP